MLTDHAELHHVAYVVGDLESAAKQWRTSFQALVELPPTLVTAHKVIVSFLRVGEQRIELVQAAGDQSVIDRGRPLDGRPDQPLLRVRRFT